MGKIGTCLQGLLKKYPKLLVQLLYMLIHLVFSVATMGIACLLWQSQVAHFLFVCTIFSATVKNAANFYFDVFETQYMEAVDHSLEVSSSSRKPISKRIAAASPGLAEMAESLVNAPTKG